LEFDLTRAWKEIQNLINTLIASLPNLVLGFLIFIFFYFAAKWANGVIRNFAERAQHGRGVGIVLGRLAQYGITVMGLLVGLSAALPTFRAGDIIQLLGIGGVAIGFAFKDIFQNFLAGIIILVTRPFRIGDQIVVRDYEGTVEDIQTRATTIRTYDNRRVLIPNTVLFTESVTVLTAYEKRRTEYDIGIGYGDDIDLAKRLIVEAASSCEGVEDQPAPDAITMAYDDSTVTIRARWWTDTARSNVLIVRDRVLREIKKRFTEEGVDLAFPTQVVLFHDQTEEADGDRATQREGWPAGRGKVPRKRFDIAKEAMESAARANGKVHEREKAEEAEESSPHTHR
jgi:small conductance mechanosensitive channel